MTRQQKIISNLFVFCLSGREYLIGELVSTIPLTMIQILMREHHFWGLLLPDRVLLAQLEELFLTNHKPVPPE